MSLFCPGCDNTLDIGRTQYKSDAASENTPSELSTSDTVINYGDLIDKIDNNDSLTDKELDKIDFIVLQKNKKFKAKSAKDKQKFKKKINELIDKKDSDDSNIKAYNICKNCSYSEQLKPRQRIISRLSDISTSTDLELDIKDKNKLYSMVLPLTREYSCPNKSCRTHKGHPREAKFFRTKGTTHVKYLCTVCRWVWQVS